jgi:hypothetical protein
MTEIDDGADPRLGGTKYGNTRRVADITGLSESLLTKLRLHQPSESPPFLRVGSRVLYPLDGDLGLEGWAARRIQAGRIEP